MAGFVGNPFDECSVTRFPTSPFIVAAEETTTISTSLNFARFNPAQFRVLDGQIQDLLLLPCEMELTRCPSLYSCLRCLTSQQGWLQSLVTRHSRHRACTWLLEWPPLIGERNFVLRRERKTKAQPRVSVVRSVSLYLSFARGDAGGVCATRSSRDHGNVRVIVRRTYKDGNG